MSVNSYLQLISPLKVLHRLRRILNSHSLGMSLDLTNAFIHCTMCPWFHWRLSDLKSPLDLRLFSVFKQILPLSLFWLFWEFITPVLANVFPLEFEWQQVPSSLQGSYSILADLNKLDYFIIIMIISIIGYRYCLFLC